MYTLLVCVMYDSLDKMPTTENEKFKFVLLVIFLDIFLYYIGCLIYHHFGICYLFNWAILGRVSWFLETETLAREFPFV